MKTPPVSSTANELEIPSPDELHRPHGPVAAIDRADQATAGDEPEQPLPVGQHRDDPVAGGDLRAQVVVAVDGEARPARVGDDEHVAVVRRDHRPVVLVEVEVAAAREVGERVAARCSDCGAAGAWRPARRGCAGRAAPAPAGRARRRRSRSAPGESKVIEPHSRANSAEGSEPSPSGPESRVGVGHVGVVVDVAAPVRRHEGVAGRLRHPADRAGVAGVPSKGAAAATHRVARDRQRRQARDLCRGGPSPGRPAPREPPP